MFSFFQLTMETIKAAPVDLVNTAALGSSSVVQTDVSFISLILQADIIVKCVILLLLLASVWSWTIIFNKWVMFKLLRSKMKSFEKNFWSTSSLEALFERIRGRENHPMAMIFVSAMQEWQGGNTKAALPITSELRFGMKERIYQAIQVAINKSLDNLERNLGFLATVGSSAPFIGLFGTVWGIMISFQSIAISKNTTLAVVAPGIAESLLATAFGLVVAIPAVIFYNKFASEVNNFSSTLESFGSELNSIITKEIDSIK